jgi:hypothetical protein
LLAAAVDLLVVVAQADIEQALLWQLLLVLNTQ